MKRWITRTMMVFMAFAITAGVSLAGATPVRADGTGVWGGCVNYWSLTTNYNYTAPGVGDIYTTGWFDYIPEQVALNPDSTCADINVQDVAGDGDNSMTIRTVICPDSGSCYALSWGALTPFVTYGVTAPWQQLPCGGSCEFLFRIETLNDSDTFRLIF